MTAETDKVEPADSEQEEEEELYEGERIIDMRVEEGKVLYRVRWKNYGSDDDTWEPEEHLQNCAEVLLAFKKSMADAEAKESAKMLPTTSDVFDEYSESDSDKERPTESPIKKKKKTKMREDAKVSPQKEKKMKDKRREEFRPLPAPETDEEEERALTPPSSPKEKKTKSKKRMVDTEEDDEAVPTKKHKKEKGKEGGELQTQALKPGQSYGFSLDSDEREGEESAAKPRPGEEPRDRRERPEEAQRPGWERRTSTDDRRKRREDSEPRLFMACDDNQDIQEPPEGADKSDKGTATLSLGMDLNLDWVTLDDFPKLNGEDELSLAPPLSPSELRDAVESDDYISEEVGCNSKEDCNQAGTTSGCHPKGDGCEAAPRFDTEAWSVQDRLLDAERKLSEVELKLNATESQVATLSTTLEALTKRLSAVEARQFGSACADDGGDPQPAASATPACPSSHSPIQATPTPAPQTDISLRTISAEREEIFYRQSCVSGEHRPEIYAASLFMALAPFDVYGTWVKTSNWSGSNGKVALPHCIKARIHDYVAQRFPDLSWEHWHRIRRRINERLRCPRKLDPETQQPGFCRR